MTIHIPEWALWVLGIGIGVPALAALACLVALGIAVLRGL